jgi:hypothetical protein
MTQLPSCLLILVSLVSAFNFYIIFSPPGVVQNKPILSFNKERSFKILQLTDLHLGEDPDTDWAPAADQKTFSLLRKLIKVENPDLIVLGGDQLTGNNVDENATVYYDLLADLLESFSIPYALIFGNHDDMDLEVRLPNDSLVIKPAKTSRRQLLRSDQRHAHSLVQEGPSHVFGVSNYMLSVYQGDNVKLQVVLLDSGGGSLPQEIVQSQLDWYQSQRLAGVDAVAFQHIPTHQFQFANNKTCKGYKGEDITPLESDPVGEVSVLDVHFLAVGHNHGNSYCCPRSDNLHVCFGRHSGYGGYGHWDKGGRVFEIMALDDNAVEWRSWVRMESGHVMDEYNPYPNTTVSIFI